MNIHEPLGRLLPHKGTQKSPLPSGERVRVRGISLVLSIFLFMEISISGIGMAQGPDYVGGGKCKLCHPKEHKVWNESKHAKAFEALKQGEQKEPRCLSCHVTGYNQHHQAIPEMAGVQCEACHGPGSLYIKVHAKKDKEGARKAGLIVHPSPEACKNCHNPDSPTFNGFDYPKMWEKIKHQK